MNLEVVILAAGQGTRMKSSRPKVLHPLAGKPMLLHVIDSAHHLSARKIHVVYGHGGDQVMDELGHLQGVDWSEQVQQLGTGHAVQQAMPKVSDDSTVLILYGDVPLIRESTLQLLIQTVYDQQMGLLTTCLDDPAGYGRIVRNQQHEVIKIVEHKDANESELKINEINTGIMAVKAGQLKQWLARLDNNNSQGEYYLTDIIEMAVNDGIKVIATVTDDDVEVSGINDKVQLQQMERAFQYRQAEDLMREGVTIVDAQRFDVRGDCHCGQDVVLDVNVIIEGQVKLGDRVTVGPNVILKNVEVGDDTSIFANTVIEDAKVGASCRIGPFARIRPETILADHAHVGNFVEIKKSKVGQGSKINHLSYIGDSEVGSGVNIGAGTITCNYDGANKFKTVIGDDCFIGSDTQLIAPVNVGKGATIAAGSTITRDAPEGKLTISRVKQTTIENWQRPTKQK